MKKGHVKKKKIKHKQIKRWKKENLAEGIKKKERGDWRYKNDSIRVTVP